MPGERRPARPAMAATAATASTAAIAPARPQLRGAIALQLRQRRRLPTRPGSGKGGHGPAFGPSWAAWLRVAAGFGEGVPVWAGGVAT